MLSVPGKTGDESVESMMREYLHDDVNPIIVHRLDMDTSGLMVVAKTRWTYTELQKQFLEHQVEKTYVALLEHMPEGKPLKGTISLPLRPDIYDRPRQLVDWENGKEAITEYWISRKDEGGGRKEITSEIQDTKDSVQNTCTQYTSPSSFLPPPSSIRITPPPPHRADPPTARALRPPGRIGGADRGGCAVWTSGRPPLSACRNTVVHSS